MQKNICDLDPNESKIKNYNIIKIIGFGASGIIYQVYKKEKNSINKKRLILKQIPFSNTNLIFEEASELLKKAKNESLILSNLNYKYIVKYYESFIEDDCLNIIMDYYEKGDLNSLLENLIKKNKYLNEEQIWHFFIQLSLGLEYIHQKNIIHRDLKPMNIFITRNNQIKIGDLGIAKMIKTFSKANTFLGTPYYMSPELCEGKPYNAKSDIWALGCILYELCSLKKPFNAFNQAALFMKIIEGKYIPLSKLKGIPSYSKKFEYFVNMMLEKNCDKRPFMKDILMNKIFYEKAKELGYENDIKFVLKECKERNDYNNKRMTPSNNKRIKNIGIRRLNSSIISSNKKVMNKIPRLNSYKMNNKKLKRKYQILQNNDSNIIISKDKKINDKNFKNNKSFSRNRDLDISSKNVLTSINNYQGNKRKYSHPNINLKKFPIKNNKIQNNYINKIDTRYIKFISLNNNQNISYINNKVLKQESKEKESNEKTNISVLKNFINKKCNNIKSKKIKPKGIKILSIDKKYSSIVKPTLNISINNKDKNYKYNEYKKNQKKKLFKETKIYKVNDSNNQFNIINNSYFELQNDPEEYIITQNTSTDFDKINEDNCYDNLNYQENVSVLKEKVDYNLLKNEKIEKQKEQYLLKYNECKNEILKFKNIIDINKLFDLYGLISIDKNNIEEISKKIEIYLKSNLTNESYKKLKNLFKKFIFYDINIENINRFY